MRAGSWSSDEKGWCAGGVGTEARVCGDVVLRAREADRLDELRQRKGCCLRQRRRKMRGCRERAGRVGAAVIGRWSVLYRRRVKRTVHRADDEGRSVGRRDRRRHPARGQKGAQQHRHEGEMHGGQFATRSHLAVFARRSAFVNAKRVALLKRRPRNRRSKFWWSGFSALPRRAKIPRSAPMRRAWRDRLWQPRAALPPRLCAYRNRTARQRLAERL